MSHKYRLSLRKKGSKEFMGDEKTWEKAESILRKILDKKVGKGKYEVAEGEGAFYGPKVDIIMKDSMGREWQMGTIQLDMQMPLRFGLKYIDKENREKTPIVIHRVIYGSLERFIAILLEHTNGRLPVWLAPIQVRILSFTDRNIAHSKNVIKQLAEKIPELRIDADFRSTTVPSKVKEAEIMRIPYIIVIGDKEEKDRTLAVRVKGDSRIKAVKLEKFIEDLKEEIDKKR